MTLLAVPFQPLGVNERTAQSLLDGMLSVPAIFPTPGTVEERRVLIASILTDPLNRVWLVWQSGALIGCLLLTHIIPGVDAEAHFVFFDRVLFGRRTLLWNLMGKVFTEYQFQRLTVEVPEYLTPLYKFVRKKLMFRLEGEAVVHPLTAKVAEALKPYVANSSEWVARLGSRRERACLNPETNTWCDMLRLRLLRSEYAQVEQEAHASRPTQSLSSPRHPGSPPATDRLSPESAGLRQFARGAR